MQAMNHVGGDAAGLQHQARQRRGERSALAIGTSDCSDLLGFVPSRCGHQPIRVFNCRITSGMVRPSARAANVRAIRCLRTGSARSSTSSMDGANPPPTNPPAPPPPTTHSLLPHPPPPPITLHPPPPPHPHPLQP